MDKILFMCRDTIFQNKVKRTIKSYELKFCSQDINNNTVRKYLNQYNPIVLVIHHSVECNNLSILLDYLITNKVIPIIYINNTSNYGQFYNVINDVYFTSIEENKLEQLLEIVLNIFIKLRIEFTLMNKKIIKLENKIKDDNLIVKAKLKLMKDLNLSEEESYKYILKKSMNQRKSKGQIAKKILES